MIAAPSPDAASPQRLACCRLVDELRGSSANGTGPNSWPSTGQFVITSKPWAEALSKMTPKHTPGPWYADNGDRIWRRDPNELHENGGGVAGDRPIAAALVGFYGDEVVGYPAAANARLIAAAPDLYDACAEFVRKVEAGEARSTRSYAQMKAALEKAAGGPE